MIIDLHCLKFSGVVYMTKMFDCRISSTACVDALLGFYIQESTWLSGKYCQGSGKEQFI